MKIKELTLFTNQIAEQRHFYETILGLEIIEDAKNEISFKTGNSILKFQNKKESKPYHFAFNIPSNQIEGALSWLKERVEIQKDGSREIIDFPAWKANSIYFYDTDKNILEFIARKNLHNTSSNSFSSESILEISEIGIATNNFTEAYNFLTINAKLQKFSGKKEVFCAIGSETGLFILIDKNRKDWFPTNDKAYAADFNLTIEIKEQMKFIEYKNEILNFKT